MACLPAGGGLARPAFGEVVREGARPRRRSKIRLRRDRKTRLRRAGPTTLSYLLPSGGPIPDPYPHHPPTQTRHTRQMLPKCHWRLRSFTPVPTGLMSSALCLALPHLPPTTYGLPPLLAYPSLSASITSEANGCAASGPFAVTIFPDRTAVFEDQIAPLALSALS